MKRSSFQKSDNIFPECAPTVNLGKLFGINFFLFFCKLHICIIANIFYQCFEMV
jgi:hypothetical protein